MPHTDENDPEILLYYALREKNITDANKIYTNNPTIDLNIFLQNGENIKTCLLSLFYKKYELFSQLNLDLKKTIVKNLAYEFYELLVEPNETEKTVSIHLKTCLANIEKIVGNSAKSYFLTSLDNIKINHIVNGEEVTVNIISEAIFLGLRGKKIIDRLLALGFTFQNSLFELAYLGETSNLQEYSSMFQNILIFYDNNGYLPIFYAIAQAHIETVEFILIQHPEQIFNYSNSSQETCLLAALHWCANKFNQKFNDTEKEKYLMMAEKIAGYTNQAFSNEAKKQAKIYLSIIFSKPIQCYANLWKLYQNLLLELENENSNNDFLKVNKILIAQYKNKSIQYTRTFNINELKIPLQFFPFPQLNTWVTFRIFFEYKTESNLSKKRKANELIDANNNIDPASEYKTKEQKIRIY